MRIQNSSFKTAILTLATTALFGLGACSSSDEADELFVGIDDCSQRAQNLFVSDVLDQWYFWNDTIPNVNPENFTSVDSLLDALVVNAPEVDRFSFITDQASNEAFLDRGEFTGLGFTSRNIDNRLFLALVFSGSPAETAGLTRGFELTRVNGVDVASTLAAGNSVDFGASAIGTNVSIEYLDLDGNSGSANITKETIRVDTVSASRIIDNNGVNTGYLHFYTFVQPSVTALETTFREFKNSNVEELVVDLRYNGGGLVSVAEQFASLIGGTTTSGEVFFDQLFNADRAASNDRTVRFTSEINALNLDRVVIITDAGTASASELIINGLSPFLNVVLVGDTTFGKPVGQLGFDFCGQTLYPVTFETVNASNEGRYFGGLTVDCPADDDVSRSLGDETEASLAEALQYLNTGACSPVAVTRQSKQSTPQIEVIKEWRLHNAH